MNFRNGVYYESINRELKIRPIYEFRCDERLQTKTKEFTRLVYTGLVVELEHLLRLTRKTATVVRVLPTCVFNCSEKVARRKWKSPGGLRKLGLSQVGHLCDAPIGDV